MLVRAGIAGKSLDPGNDCMHDPAPSPDVRATVVPIRDAPAQFPHIPGYRFQKRLGQGGMATVYLATQESLDRPVCIKVMDRDALADETSKQRFENEARTIAKLSHPNIVAIYEVGRTDDGRLYYIMPYLANGDLAQRDLRDDDRRIGDTLRSLLSALGYAHARGIVHRDVKRENVLFDTDDRPMLADFGIAISKSDDARITTAGLAVGSSGYMAPEQARGDVVDGRADLYSVGVLAFELLTGDLPFRAPDALSLALLHVQSPIPRLPPMKRHWQGLVDRAMAKSPDQRFANAQQMIEALDGVGRRTGTHISSRVLRTFDRTVDGRGWKRPWVLALAAALLLATGAYAARDKWLPLVSGKSPAVQPAASVANVVPAPKAASTAAPSVSPAASSMEADAASPTSSAASNTEDASAASASGSQDSTSSASSDASSSKSSSKRTSHAKHSTPRQRPPPRENFIKRLWHRI
jgi:serine/threonine protein kinase